MIWRMERRTVVAAMVGANCSMDETLDAIWAEVTTQSSALLPVLRLMALRAMKRLEKHYEGIGRARHSTFMSFRRQSWISGTTLIASTRRQRTTVVFGCIQRVTVESLASLNQGKRTTNNFTENKPNKTQHIHPQPFLSTPTLFKESLLPLQPRNVSTRLFLLHSPFLPSNIHQRSSHARGHFIR
jgi:hypothetical protein